MKRINLLLLLSVLFLPGYALAQSAVCPCDIATLGNGLTGSDIIEIVCPGGSLGSDSGFFLDSNGVEIKLNNPPNTNYVVQQSESERACVINSDGVQPVFLFITPEDYLSCREQLIDRCDLLTRNIPTLSEWGLIATAGVLGIAALIAARRRKAAA